MNTADLLAEAVAQNVSAPPELLSKLATHDRKAVTSNLKTSKKIIFNLGVFFPQELLNNLIFDFSLLYEI